MTKLRYDGLSTQLDGDLASGGGEIGFTTALTHSGGVPVPTIVGGSSDHYVPLSILDSDGRLLEVVGLWEYTEGDAGGSIFRGLEDTSAADHDSGAIIVQSPLVSDLPSDTPESPAVFASSSAYTNGSSTLGVVVPAGVEDGDVLVFMAFSSYPVSSVTDDVQTYKSHIDYVSTWLGMLPGSPAMAGDTVTVTCTGSDAIVLYCVVVRGAHAVDGFGESFSGGADVVSLKCLPSTSRLNGLIVAAGAFRIGGSTVALIPADSTLVTRGDTSYSSALVQAVATGPLTVVTTSLSGGSPSKAGCLAVTFS